MPSNANDYHTTPTPRACVPGTIGLVFLVLVSGSVGCSRMKGALTRTDYAGMHDPFLAPDSAERAVASTPPSGRIRLGDLGTNPSTSTPRTAELSPGSRLGATRVIPATASRAPNSDAAGASAGKQIISRSSPPAATPAGSYQGPKLSDFLSDNAPRETATPTSLATATVQSAEVQQSGNSQASSPGPDLTGFEAFLETTVEHVAEQTQQQVRQVEHTVREESRSQVRQAVADSDDNLRPARRIVRDVLEETNRILDGSAAAAEQPSEQQTRAFRLIPRQAAKPEDRPADTPSNSVTTNPAQRSFGESIRSVRPAANSIQQSTAAEPHDNPFSAADPFPGATPSEAPNPFADEPSNPFAADDEAPSFESEGADVNPFAAPAQHTAPAPAVGPGLFGDSDGFGEGWKSPEQ